MPASHVDELSAPVRTLVAAYLDDVRRSLHSTDPELAADTVAGLESHLLELLGTASTAADARLVIESLGPLEGAHPDETAGSEADSRTVLGMPVEVRPLTGERVASRWWNPADQRLFMPRVFGLGWDLNLGALAVRVGLIEPDAEDEPFVLVPDRYFSAALAVPVVLTIAIATSYVALEPSLAERLPVHWDFWGTPDRYASKPVAFGLPFVLAALSTAWACITVVARRSKLSQAGALGFSAFMSALSAGVWAVTAFAGVGQPAPPWAFAAVIVSTLGVPFVVFTVLARSGRAVEIRRDLDRGRARTSD